MKFYFYVFDKKENSLLFFICRKNAWFFMYLKIKKKPFPRFATFSSCLLTDMVHLANFALQSIPPLYIYYTSGSDRNFS